MSRRPLALHARAPHNYVQALSLGSEAIGPYLECARWSIADWLRAYPIFAEDAKQPTGGERLPFSRRRTRGRIPGPTHGRALPNRPHLATFTDLQRGARLSANPSVAL